MRCSNCGICCTETEMLLAEKDITRLLKKGYAKSFFVKYDRRGYAQLKNSGGYCVFYDSKKRLCNVYFDRPSGCRVYPIMLDEDEEIVLDEICPEIGSINKKEKELRGKKVVALLKKIDDEAASRRF